MPDPTPRPLPVPDASRAALRDLIHNVWSGRFPEHDPTITAIAAPVVVAVLRDLSRRAPEAVVEDWPTAVAKRIEEGT